MTLRDRYRDLIDEGTSSLPGEAEAFERLGTATGRRRRLPRFAIAAAAVAAAIGIAIAILPRRTPAPPSTETMSIYISSSDRPGEAMEIVITADRENHP